jgi:hypothetical protein
MSHSDLHKYSAIFFTVLCATLVGLVLINGVKSIVSSRPVMTALDDTFKVCPEFKTVKPGAAVCYKIHYFKRLDIPGDVSKQLIVTDKRTGQEVYIPLVDTAGHLPPGNVSKLAYARIPDWTPEGKAKIKISSTHNIGGPPQHTVVYTDEFEVKK